MYLKQLSKEQLQALYAELNITEESLERDVNYLIEWMEKQPHLPKVTDKIFISHILFQCKNSLEKTKKKLNAYYIMKAAMPNIYSDRDPTTEEFKTTFRTMGPVLLPKILPDGNRIVFFRIFEPENSNLLKGDDITRVCFTIFDIMMKQDCYKKHILIYDLHNITIGYAYTLLHMFQKYLPQSMKFQANRIHKTHVLMNMNATLWPLFNLVKSFLTKKLADTIILWNEEKPNFSTIYPPEIIPEEYGGTEKSILTLREEFYEYICGFRGWLKSEENCVADLSKIPADSSIRIAVDGSVDGSFRQLAID